MITGKNSPVASFDTAERLLRNARSLVGFRLNIRPNKSNSRSVKPGRHLPALILFCLVGIAPVIAQTNSVDYWAPWVTKTTTHSATINWHGDNDGLGLIDYATKSYYDENQSFKTTAAAPTMDAYQHVQLTGLKPDTEYIYRVRPSCNAGAFGNRSFRTMPVSGPFTFVVISDSQEGHTYTEAMRFRYVADAVAKETNVLFVLHGGDNAGHDSEGLWGKYFAAADKMLAKVAIFPTIGNHEYHNSDGGSNLPTAAVQYHQAYDVPLHYSFDCSGVRFIILDSPDPASLTNGEFGIAAGGDDLGDDDPHPSLALTLSQVPWLKKQLNNNLRGTFTIHHHPIWDEGRTTIDTNLQPWEVLYHTYKISATFAGHTHNYQRYSVQGIPYFIAGFGGGRCADLSTTNAVWLQFTETRKLGYIKVTVDPAKNTATAQEIIAATVQEDDSDETPQVYDPAIPGDTVTFPLRQKRLM